MDRFDRFSLAITQISRCWRRLASEEMEKYGLKGTHATYLTNIYRFEEGVTVSQLCELSGKDKSDASRMMAILIAKGFVKKQLVKGSLYRGRLVLTEKGREAAEQVSCKAARAVELAGKDLSEQERTIFYQAMESIVNNLKELDRDGIPE